MPRPNTTEDNPFSSPIKDIVFSSEENDVRLSIIDKTNGFCQFEKIEMIESVFELLPSGGLVVRDTSDIITYISTNKLDTLEIYFQDDTAIYCSINGTSYINNAASETEENFVLINFSNHLYKHSQQHSLTQLIKAKKPQVHKIYKFIETFVSTLVTSIKEDYKKLYDPFIGENTETSNYLLYKQLNPMEYRMEAPNENYLEYLYYVSSNACEKLTEEPRYLFWTEFSNRINFKFFPKNPDDDTKAIEKMNSNSFYYAVYNSDVPLQNVSNEDTAYKKIYILKTAPADQFVSKKYFYIRKTPKLLNKNITQTAAYPYDLLSYQFQDEGQKYDVEIIGSDGVLSEVQNGADQLMYKGHWGYYDDMLPQDSTSMQTHISQEFGTESSYKGITFMGVTGNYPYADCADMWKNMFDFTPVHPHTPTININPEGNNTKLQKMIDIRWRAYGVTNDKLIKIRNIEKQNFIMYTLCCVDESEESFFAQIYGYKPEVSTYDSKGRSNEPLKYLYAWNKINCNVTFSGTTPSYDFRALENWKKDDKEKTNEEDITTFAINTNERTNSKSAFGKGFYAPGWYIENLGTEGQLGNGITYRSVKQDGGGLNQTQGLNGTSSESTPLIVKMYKTPIRKLLMESGITDPKIYEIYAGKYLYTFSAENVVDGACP